MARATTSKMEEYLSARQGAERSDSLIRVGGFALGLVLLLLAGWIMRPINDIRRSAQLTLNPESIEGLPPDVALMTKTATLRAVALVAGFQRLEELKEKNQFYELMQLSDWLCKLAPRYAKVWSYAAWNMAYNISVLEYSPEARWLWVSNGIEALRSKGIPYNPQSITLYKELAWIFFHKIGDRLDDQHRAYKAELAVEMQILFGEPPLGRTAAEVVEQFRAIVDAPRDWYDYADLAAKHPEFAPLMDALREVELLEGDDLLRFVAADTALRKQEALASADDEESKDADRSRADRRAVLDNPRFAETLPQFLNILRSRAIRQDLHMNLDWMLTLMEKPPWLDATMRARFVTKYGPDSVFVPVDWRLPFAHTLYWGTYGDMVTGEHALRIDPADSMNAVRFIFFALDNMARSGQVILEPNFQRPNRSFLEMLPDNRFIMHMHQAYLHYGEEQFRDDPKFIPGTSGPNYWGGHRNFLVDSIQQLYLAGGPDNMSMAKELFFYLREFDRDEKGEIKARYQNTFEQFVFEDMFEDLDTQKRAQLFISELLSRSLREAGEGDIESAIAHTAEAKKWWNHYMRDKQETERNDRRRLQPLGMMRRDMALLYMLRPDISLLQKSRLWRALDLPTRQAVYDDALEAITQRSAEHDPPYDPSRVMPEPPGMKEYRENPERVLKKLEVYDETVYEGAKIREL